MLPKYLGISMFLLASKALALTHHCSSISRMTDFLVKFGTHTVYTQPRRVYVYSTLNEFQDRKPKST